LAKGNGTHVASAMQVEPVDDRFGRFAKRLEIARKIRKSLIVAEQHVAMPSARPQARLPLDAHVLSPALLEGLFDMVDEDIAARPAIGSGLLLIAETAGCTKNEGAHKAQREITIDGAVSPMEKNSRPVNHPLHMTSHSIAFIASDAPEAKAAQRSLAKRYGNIRPAQAKYIVALGGDGLMLHTLHRYGHSGKPIYGMNCGSVGFLMNDFAQDDLAERLAQAEATVIHPLRMTSTNMQGQKRRAIAYNEVSVWRQTYQAAKLAIAIDGKERLKELIADGLLVATPAGSTAYNLSAHGPILPINSRLLAVTPLSPFRPRRWRGAILPHDAKIALSVLEPDKRPVAAVADHTEFRNVRSVLIAEDPSIAATLLFDRGSNLSERVLSEQFLF
jgi:NAD+ kinase